MIQAIQVPMICDDCGGTLTDDDAIWSSSLGIFSHINYSQCIASLNERLTATTKRAEAAEAERDDVIAICRGTQLDDAAIHSMRGYVTEKLRIEAECEALRQRAEAERENVSSQLWDCMNEREGLRTECNALRTVDDAMVERAVEAYDDAAIKSSAPTILWSFEAMRAALTAALAVQPTTSTKN